MIKVQNRRSASDIILGMMFVVITLLYGLFMVRDWVPIFGLIVLAGLWLSYALVRGRLSKATPIDLPIIALLALLPLSMAISVDWSLSLPKVTGLVLGIVIFYWIINFVQDYQRLGLAILGLILLCFGVTLLGLFGMDWSTSRFTEISESFSFLTKLLPSIPRQDEVGIHANTVGGALTFFLPLLAGLAWDGDGFYRVYLKGRKHGEFLHILYKLAVILAFILAAIMLFLTDSRGALLGSAVGLLILALWKDRRFFWLIPVSLLSILLIFFIIAEGSTNQFIALLETTQESTLGNRLNVWRKSLALIQDFPLTGLGIGTTGQIFNDFYHFTVFQYNSTFYLHAHNTFLAVAVDLGLPALVLYSALLTGFAEMIRRRVKMVRSNARTLLQGIACGLLAHHIFGLMDAFELGTKLGAILWIFLGLAAATYVHKENFLWQNSGKHENNATRKFPKPNGKQVKAHLLEILIGLGFWVLISLAAVSFVNINSILSIAIAMIGGVLLGYLLIKRFRKSSLSHPLHSKDFELKAIS